MVLPQNVLLIDDDEVSNFIHKELIIRVNEDAFVYSCGNGTEAIQYLYSLQKRGKSFPDLILADINMPLMGGMEFVERYENFPGRNGSSNIIMLTTAINPTDEKRVGKTSNITFVEKPLSRDRLLQIIGETAMKMQV